MKILVDTHAFLWAIGDDPRLSPRARQVLGAGRNELFFSVASIWEILTKIQIGKFRLPGPAGKYIQEKLVISQMRVLPLLLSHTLQLEHLPLHHRDPFDRMLVAQSLEEDMPILTADPLLEDYPSKLIW